MEKVVDATIARRQLHPSLRFKCVNSKKEIWSLRITIYDIMSL